MDPPSSLSVPLVLILDDSLSTAAADIGFERRHGKIDLDMLARLNSAYGGDDVADVRADKTPVVFHQNHYSNPSNGEILLMLYALVGRYQQFISRFLRLYYQKAVSQSLSAELFSSVDCVPR